MERVTGRGFWKSPPEDFEVDLIGRPEMCQAWGPVCPVGNLIVS